MLERLHSCCPTSTHLDWGMVQRDERRHGEQCHAHDEALSGSFVVPGAAPEPSFRAKGQLRTSQCMRARSAPTRPLPHETLPHAALVLFTHSQGLLTTSNKAANLGSRLTLHAPLPQLNTSTQRSHTNATPSTQSCTVTGLKPIPMLKAIPMLISCPSSSSSPSPPRTRYRVPAPEPTCRAALLLVRALPQQPWATQAVGAYQGSASL